jgi:hypothetical protein
MAGRAAALWVSADGEERGAGALVARELRTLEVHGQRASCAVEELVQQYHALRSW